MTTRTLLAVGVVLVSAALIGTASAATRYVGDVLVINVREAPNNVAPTLAHLRTGDPMEVLEASGEFLKVRTADGVEGWVSAQYTSTETPKAEQIQRLGEEVSRLRSRLLEVRAADEQSSSELEQVRRDLGEQVSDLEQRLAETRVALEEAEAGRKEVSGRYEQLREQSENVVQVTQERDRLRAENRELAERAETLSKDKAAATRNAAIYWFLAGAGVLLVGWIAGLSSRRKKSRFSVG